MSTTPRVTLVAFSPDPALLYYPTMLPDGWELCRQLEDVSQGDRFCNPDDEESGWVQVALKDTGTVRSDRGGATGDPHDGRWLDAVDKRTIAYPAGQFLVLVVSTAEDGLVPDDLLAVAGSIPLVACLWASMRERVVPDMCERCSENEPQYDEDGLQVIDLPPRGSDARAALQSLTLPSIVAGRHRRAT